MPKAMTDVALAALAGELLAVKGEIAEREARAKALQAEIVAELSRRKSELVEAAGMRVRLKASTRRSYDVEGVKAKLPAAAFRRVTHLVVSPTLLKGEVEAGRLDAELAESCATVTTSAPYVVVSAA